MQDIFKMLHRVWIETRQEDPKFESGGGSQAVTTSTVIYLL